MNATLLGSLGFTAPGETHRISANSVSQMGRW
jgi:hypothetical protein